MSKPGRNPNAAAKNARTNPGRPEQRLVFDGNWKDAIKIALSRGKPPAKKKAEAASRGAKSGLGSRKKRT